MYNVAGKFKHRVAVWEKVAYTDRGGSVSYRYENTKKIWCAIAPIVGERSRAVYNEDVGDMVHTTLRFKFTCRINSVEGKNDTVLAYKGQMYKVDYAVPYFKDMQYMEIYTQLIVENDDNILTREGLGF
jgi:head-tail adaptor